VQITKRPCAQRKSAQVVVAMTGVDNITRPSEGPVAGCATRDPGRRRGGGTCSPTRGGRVAVHGSGTSAGWLANVVATRNAGHRLPGVTKNAGRRPLRNRPALSFRVPSACTDRTHRASRCGGGRGDRAGPSANVTRRSSPTPWCSSPDRRFHKSEIGSARRSSSHGSIRRGRLLRCASPGGELAVRPTTTGSRSASRRSSVMPPVHRQCRSSSAPAARSRPP
jgi:hypothetical protein